MNVTTTEWTEIEASTAALVAQRWPWLCKSRREGLHVESPLLTVSAELEAGDRLLDRSARVVRIRVDRSGCVTGGLLDVAEAARTYAEIRDAMLFVHGETSHLVVWPDGECPCGHCGGRGESRGRACERCGGKGKR